MLCRCLTQKSKPCKNTRKHGLSVCGTHLRYNCVDKHVALLDSRDPIPALDDTFVTRNILSRDNMAALGKLLTSTSLDVLSEEAISPRSLKQMVTAGLLNSTVVHVWTKEGMAWRAEAAELAGSGGKDRAIA